ncbi:hypothetical protein A5780_16715 [Nocardia sp. 852002-20019_SCH5090214]|uniref:DUF6338 family protein n=1 Tax=Nocardia sp. 852002-20019_SCH5090214 TaxID=1834087 RepID=UPI0007EBA500|nr:DUF6338 family protein [Nocardia sp. 852002-20019_SCH5090214]OBA64002.1 hypothetical protein A5780_16715 [Nocardia sp. 852002-20019_SCH5090214]
MAFPASITIVCVLFSLVPGWLYLRRLERIRPASKATGLNELLQVLAVGLSTTGLAALIVILLPPDWLLDPVALVKGGRAYVLSHLRRVAVSVTATFLLAIGIAYLFSWVRSIGGPRGFDTLGSPWVDAFNASPKGQAPWLIVEMADGRLVEGWLKAYDPDKDPKSDIVLQGRIHITPPDGERSELVKVNRYIVVGDQIVSVQICDADVLPDPSKWRGWREEICSKLRCTGEAETGGNTPPPPGKESNGLDGGGEAEDSSQKPAD